MSKKSILFEGRTKIALQTDKEDEISLKFKDDVASSDGSKKSTIKGKGSINAEISAHLFQYLDGYNVPNHFIEKTGDTELRVKKVEIIGINVVVHNIATGDFGKRFGFAEGTELKTPVIEFYLKDEKLKDPLINEYHAYALEIATSEEIDALSKLAIKVNAVLRSYFQRRTFILANFSLEFGRHEDRTILADELSLDTCILWDAETNKKMDISRLSKGAGGADKVYTILTDRILKA